MPRWLSSQKLEIIKALLADDPALLMRESKRATASDTHTYTLHAWTCDWCLCARLGMGISAETTTRAFKEPHIEAFVERPRMVLPRVQNVYISVDPSGGGSSAYAICSLARLTNGDTAVRPHARPRPPTPTLGPAPMHPLRPTPYALRPRERPAVGGERHGPAARRRCRGRRRLLRKGLVRPHLVHHARHAHEDVGPLAHVTHVLGDEPRQ